MDRNFTNEKRIDDWKRILKVTSAGHRRSGIIVADSNIRLSYSIGGFLDLSGLISDWTSQTLGIARSFSGAGRANWRAELRMPLIQNAIALKYGRPVDEVAVGVQEPDGSALEEEIYKSPQIASAPARIAAIGRRDSTVSSTLETLAEIR